jgi:hypothetical protein
LFHLFFMFANSRLQATFGNSLLIRGGIEWLIYQESALLTAPSYELTLISVGSTVNSTSYFLPQKVSITRKAYRLQALLICLSPATLFKLQIKRPEMAVTIKNEFRQIKPNHSI